MTAAGSAPPTTTQKMSTWKSTASPSPPASRSMTARPVDLGHLRVVVVVAEAQAVRRGDLAAAASRSTSALDPVQRRDRIGA